MRAFAFLISFSIAFLLFVVQPMATKLVLPVLGGTPAVWNTAMLTFQTLLLLGYAYAHVLSRAVPARWQVWMHVLLASVACLFLPLSIPLTTSDAMIANPIPYLVSAFVLHMGVPFLCLAATAPLLQSWVSRSAHPLSATPYVLYSASNLGSFVALIGYIVLIEPNFTLGDQRYIWSGLFVAAVSGLVLLGYLLRPSSMVTEHAAPNRVEIAGWKRWLLWVWLAFLPSSLSLGVTTYVTTDIAAMPFLWVMPLSIYLLSFVDAFRVKPWLALVSLRQAPVLVLVTLLLYTLNIKSTWVFSVHLLAFAALAFALHGALARLQPDRRQLTVFYFSLSVGGALGGALNGLVAPLFFSGVWEYPAVLVLSTITCLALPYITHNERRKDIPDVMRKLIRYCFAGFLYTSLLYALLCYARPEAQLSGGFWNPSLGLGAFGGALVFGFFLLLRQGPLTYMAFTYASLLFMVIGGGMYSDTTLLKKERNFFGVQQIVEDRESNARMVIHGTTSHGVQRISGENRLQPVSYYAFLQDIFDAANAAGPTPPIGLIGLGIGTVQCYAKPDQRFDFFEINPLMVMAAEDANYFTYLRDCPGRHQILLGDGRIRLLEQPDALYGLILLDAFSSDAIPAHLLTLTALQGYAKKLLPEGLLAIHTTNRHIDLWPLLAIQAKALGMEAYGKAFPDEGRKLVAYTTWVIMAPKSEPLMRVIARTDGWTHLEAAEGKPWTDDYVNVLPYMKMRH